MDEPELIQRQREILRVFREVSQQRSKDEEGIAARLQKDKESAKMELTRWKQQVDEIHARISKIFDDAQTLISSAGLRLADGRNNTVGLVEDIDSNTNSVEKLAGYMEFIDKTATGLKNYLEGGD